MTILENCCSESAESMYLPPRQIAPETFLEYATSNRHIVRDDDEDAGLCGLLDTETGERFVIESHLLMQFSIRAE